MNILVTGGMGFIGYHLVHALLTLGHDVTSVDDVSTGKMENKTKGAKYIVGSIDNLPIMEELDVNYDVVFHLAALTGIQPSFDNPLETFHRNVMGTMKVAEFCKEIDAKFIYVGSSARWYNIFISPYAMSKHVGEEVALMYNTIHDLDVHLVRPYSVYGPKELTEGDMASVIGRWRGQIEKGEPITIVGDGEQRRDFTHVYDVVDGLVEVMMTDKTPRTSAWELGHGKNYSINQVADMFIEKFGCETKNVSERQGEYQSELRKNDEAVKELYWTPYRELEDYIDSL